MQLDSKPQKLGHAVGDALQDLACLCLQSTAPIFAWSDTILGQMTTTSINLSRFAMCHSQFLEDGDLEVGPDMISTPSADAGSLLRYDYGSYFEVRMGNYSILNIATVMYLNSDESVQWLFGVVPLSPGKKHKADCGIPQA